MGIFDKTCPQCMAISPARVVRCVCGHLFDPRDEEDRTLTPELIARQEILFQEYLEARVEQATEAATVAGRAAELDPENRRKAIEAIRAKHAAEVVEGELELQRRRAQEAARVAGVEWHYSARMHALSAPVSLATPTTGAQNHRAPEVAASAPKPTPPKPTPPKMTTVATRNARSDSPPSATPARASVTPASATQVAGERNLGASVSEKRTPAARPIPDTPVEPTPPQARASGVAGTAAVTHRGSARLARQRNSALRRARLKSLRKAVTGTVVIAAKTTQGVARAAKTIIGAAAQTATKAVKAAQKRRSAGRAVHAIKDVPVLSEVVAAPATSTPSAQVSTAGNGAVTVSSAASISKPRPAGPTGRPPAARTTVKSSGGQQLLSAPVAPPALVEPEQRSVPSETFRAAQAEKIARAVEAARRLGPPARNSTCPLCTAQLPLEATSCRCGWRMNDLPPLEPPTRTSAEAPLDSAKDLQECPSCTGTIPAGARRCKCGWSVPGGASELDSVSLSRDERTALLLGLQIEHPVKST